MEGEKTNRLMMKQIEIRITFLHIGRGILHWNIWGRNHEKRDPPQSAFLNAGMKHGWFFPIPRDE